VAPDDAHRHGPPAEVVRIEARRGSAVVWAVAVRAGEDLVVTLGGGDRPHVGCVALAQSRRSTADPARRSATTSLLAIPPHKEGELASRLAGALASAAGGVVVVSAGIHEDDLSPAGIAVYVELVAELESKLLAALSRGDARAGS